jgi:hypothetical protein
LTNVLTTSQPPGQDFFVTTDNAGKQRFAVEVAASGGGVAPLTKALFVDRGSTGVATPDGSIGAPFKTLGAGLAALGAGGGTLLVVPGDYSSEPSRAVNLTAPVSIVNLAGFQGFFAGNPVTLPALTTTGASPLLLQGCITATVAMVAGLLQLFASQLNDALTGASQLIAQDSLIADVFTADVADFFHCFFTGAGLLGTSSLTIDCEACDFTGGAGPAHFTFSGPPGVLRLDSMSAYTFTQVVGTVVNGSILFEIPTPAWAQLRATFDDNVLPNGAGNLTALTGSSFSLQSSAGDFSQTAGVLKYTGLLPLVVLATGIIVLSPTGVSTAWSAAVVSKNGDMIGDGVLDTGPHTVTQTTNGLVCSQQSPGTFGGDERRKSVSLAMTRLTTLVTNDTLQIIGANGVADPSSVVGLSLIVQTVQR